MSKDSKRVKALRRRSLWQGPSLKVWAAHEQGDPAVERWCARKGIHPITF